MWKDSTKEVHMETGPIGKTLFIFTMPVLLCQLLQMLYNITDCLVIGHWVGDTGLAAVGIGGLILSVIINFFIGFSSGISVIISHHFGAYRYSKVQTAIGTVVSLGLIIGVLLTAGGFFGAERLLRWLNCPPDVLDDAVMFMTIAVFGLMPTLLYNIGTAVLRALGNTRTALYLLTASTVLNLLLDLLFVAVLEWGMQGAALATALSQFALGVLIIRRLSDLDPAYALTRQRLRLSMSDLSEIVRLSMPAGMQALFMSISSLIIQLSINAFGSSAAAGMVIFAKLEGFIYYPTFAYGIALTGFIGQNFGARRLDRVQEAVRFSIRTAIFFTIPLSILFTIFAEPLLSGFTTEAETLHHAVSAILWVLPAYAFYSVNQVYLGALKGLGNTTYPMICTLVCYAVFRVLWCEGLFNIWWDMRVIYSSYSVSFLLMFAMVFIRWQQVFRAKEESTAPAASAIRVSHA